MEGQYSFKNFPKSYVNSSAFCHSPKRSTPSGYPIEHHIYPLHQDMMVTEQKQEAVSMLEALVRCMHSRGREIKDLGASPCSEVLKTQWSGVWWDMLQSKRQMTVSWIPYTKKEAKHLEGLLEATYSKPGNINPTLIQGDTKVCQLWVRHIDCIVV